MMTPFTGTGRLVRLALRRDRIQLPSWLVGLSLILWVTVSSIVGFYPGEAERVRLAMTSAHSPVTLMTNGLVSGASLGATVMTQAFVSLAVGAALMSILAVVRHTRQNEETGRAEMIGAGIVGRDASLTAALITVALANLVLVAASVLVLVASGLPLGGSVLCGLGIGAVGLAFAAIAAVTAQIAETSRGANALAVAALGIAFVLRAVGDASGKVIDGGLSVVSAWPTWLSPIGWGQQSRAFDRDQWWVLGILALFVVVLVSGAFVLASRRDLGAGMRAVRPGRPAAAPALLSPSGLAWRLHRGVLIGWAAGVAVLGASYGGVADEISEMLSDSPEIAQYFEQLGGASLTDTFFAVTMSVAGIAAAAYAVQATLRMRSEEAAGRVEPLLGTAVSRPRWMAANIGVVALGTLVLMVVAGVTAGVVYGLVVGDVGSNVTTLIGAALVQVPAALVLAGVAVAAFGLLPRWAAAISWASFAACLVVLQLGVILDLPQAVLDLSPFTHVPAAPAEDATALPLFALLTAAVALTAVGITAFRRRDLALP
ncbi:MAG: anibiotic ABC transporter [Jiangellaceae bacterium]|nr:anibiotic ABC transporter [Jiangellaceae bacterium]